MNVQFAVHLAMTLAILILVVTVSVVPGQARRGISVFDWLFSATPTPLQKLRFGTVTDVILNTVGAIFGVLGAAILL